MKKSFTILLVILGMSFVSQAQVNPHAIGIRFGGDGYYNGAELTYQQKVGNITRLEFDFGFRAHKNYSDFMFTLAYQWDLKIVGGLNWYIGPCAAVGFYNWNDHYWFDDDYHYSSGTRGLNLGLGAQVGLEYDFNHLGAPLLISLDARPMFDFFGYQNGDRYNHGFGWGAAFSIRYTW